MDDTTPLNEGNNNYSKFLGNKMLRQMLVSRTVFVGLGSLVIFPVFVSSESVNAETITFSNITNPNPGYNASFVTLEIDNFIFESQGIFDTDLVFEPDTCFFPCVPGDLPYLASGGSRRTTSMQPADNTWFSLSSIDASKISTDPLDILNSPELFITGLTRDNTTVSVSFNLDLGFQTFLLPQTFTNLKSVTFAGVFKGNEDDNLAIDNIVFSRDSTSISEPNSTLSLLAFSTLGAGLTLKRRLKQKSTSPEKTEGEHVNESRLD